jgi:hypothetical protein
LSDKNYQLNLNSLFSETKFEIFILVNNLIDKCIYLEYFDGLNIEKVSLNKSTNIKLKIILEKSSVNEYLNKINDEFLVSEILSEKLNIKYSFDSDCKEFYTLIFEKQKLSLNYKNIVFKNPFDFELKSLVNESLNEQKVLFLYSVVVFSKGTDLENQNEYFLSIEILNKINLKFINGIKKWRFQV